jgi:hypothetical protein
VVLLVVLVLVLAFGVAVRRRRARVATVEQQRPTEEWMARFASYPEPRRARRRR